MPSLRRPSIAAATLAILAILAGFVVHVSRLPDPSVGTGMLHMGDSRAHRYGSMKYAQVETLIDGLRAEQRAASAPEQRAVSSVRLADVLVARQMFPEALVEIEEARRLAPGESEVLWRLAVIQRQLGSTRDAAATIAEAERLAPGDPHVQKAAEFVRDGS